MLDVLTIKPACWYTEKQDLEEMWQSGKDFKIVNGGYLSIRDTKSLFREMIVAIDIEGKLMLFLRERNGELVWEK